MDPETERIVLICFAVFWFLVAHTMIMYSIAWRQFSKTHGKFIDEMRTDYEKGMNSLSGTYQQVIDKLKVEKTVEHQSIVRERYQSRSYVKRSGISPGVRFKIMQRDKFKCCICGRTASDNVRLEIDHKMPVAKGGTNDESNLHTLCDACNAGKSDLYVAEIVSPH